MTPPQLSNFSLADFFSTLVSASLGYIVGLFHGKNSNG